MSEPFDLTLIEDFANCGLRGHKGTVAGAGLRRNKNVRIFDSGGRSDSSDDSSEDLNESDSEDSYNVLDHISLPAMVSHQNSGQLSEEDRTRARCERLGMNYTEEYHKRYIFQKVKELNQNNEWWGPKEWNDGICSKFAENDRITGQRAYEIALGYGMKQKYRTDDHREYISNKVKELNQNNEWWGPKEWNDGICSKFAENDRIAGKTAYNIALGYGMKQKYRTDDHREYIFQKVKELNQNNEWWGPKEWNDGICSKFAENDRITGQRAYNIALGYGMKQKYRTDDHREYISNKVKELNQNNEWWGPKEWNDGICSKFAENDRITGQRAYNIALERGMKRKYGEHAATCSVVMEDRYHSFIKKKVIETKKRWTGEIKLHKDISSKFEEWGRISKAKAYNIALESGMHTKVLQHTIDNLKAAKPDNIPMCNWCGDYRKLLECTRCRSVKYCNRECQRADWGEHKKICGHK